MSRHAIGRGTVSRHAVGQVTVSALDEDTLSRYIMELVRGTISRHGTGLRHFA